MSVTVFLLTSLIITMVGTAASAAWEYRMPGKERSELYEHK
jgi:hypothetical protein